MNNHLAVLLPHYNNPSGLRLTLESLLQETEVFTLFVIDDGSDDFRIVEHVVEDYKELLKIVLKRNNVNKGITNTLNEGLKHIISLNKFSLIARLDAGDVCLNNRFKNQKEVFFKDKAVGLVGSWVKFVSIDRKLLFIFKPPSNPSKLKKAIHCYNPFVHPSVMFRKDVVKELGFYSEDYPALEDHAYFFKIIKAFKTTIVENVLLEYEINPKGISAKNRKEQTKSRIKLFLKEYKFGIYTTIGLLRACITYLLPQRLLILMKKNVFYK